MAPAGEIIYDDPALPGRRDAGRIQIGPLLSDLAELAANLQDYSHGAAARLDSHQPLDHLLHHVPRRDRLRLRLRPLWLGGAVAATMTRCGHGASRAAALRGARRDKREMIPAAELPAFQAQLLGMVRPGQARPRLAQDARSLPRVDLRDHAAADARRRRASLLPAILDALPDRATHSLERGRSACCATGPDSAITAAPATCIARRRRSSPGMSGNFPKRLDEALALPGIGHYTAAAVLSIAYGEPHAVLDGNVARVLARLGAIRGELRQPNHWRELADAAKALLPAQGTHDAGPGDWNQAMMELGATLCTPRAPQCGALPGGSLVPRPCAGDCGALPSRAQETPADQPRALRGGSAGRSRAHPACYGRRTITAFYFRTCGSSPPFRRRNRTPENSHVICNRLLAFRRICNPCRPRATRSRFARILLAPFLVRVRKLPVSRLSTLGGVRKPVLSELERLPYLQRHAENRGRGARRFGCTLTPRSRNSGRTRRRWIEVTRIRDY